MLNEVKRVICKECHGYMHKAGKVWSGKHKAQRYRCNACGFTTTNPQPHQDNFTLFITPYTSQIGKVIGMD